jgi:hypothetical protein
MTRREFAWNAGALGAGIITQVPLGARAVIDQNTIRRRGTGRSIQLAAPLAGRCLRRRVVMGPFT